MDLNLIYLLIIPILLISLSVHEFAHALIAYVYGDPTAKNDGRLTINPVAHWDPIGTTLLVGLLAMGALGARLPFIFGWGKPVPVNEGNFQNPVWEGLQVAIAGPMSNFILALLLAVIIRLTNFTHEIDFALTLALRINLFLMFFNLIPVPPLDGSRLLRLVISEDSYSRLAYNPTLFWGMFIIIIIFGLPQIAIWTERLTNLLISIQLF